MSDVNTRIATEILKQLGGNGFRVMTGAKNVTIIENGVAFKIGRNSGKCNYIRITLNSLDLYDIEFKYITKKSNKTIKEFNDVYNDMLVNIFETITGLYTKLF